jgi:hypothetical protein
VTLPFRDEFKARVGGWRLHPNNRRKIQRRLMRDNGRFYRYGQWVADMEAGEWVSEDYIHPLADSDPPELVLVYRGYVCDT